MKERREVRHERREARREARRSKGEVQYFRRLPAPLRPQFRVPDHPHMRKGVTNSMHANSYNTDTHHLAGPTGPDVEVEHETFGHPVGMCPTFAVDRKGRVVMICVKGGKTELQLRDGRTLEILDRFDLPPKPDVVKAVLTLRLDKVFTTSGSGAYFFLDKEDRAVIATADREVVVIGQRESGGRVELVCERRYDLKGYVPSSHCGRAFQRDWKEDPRCDAGLNAVAPDWEGRLWASSSRGRIVVITPGRTVGKGPSKSLRDCPEDKGATIHWKQLELRHDELSKCRDPDEVRKWGKLAKREEIQNSFGAGPDGVYIVSECKAYRFRADASGKPVEVWRYPYARGTRIKPGQLNRGSGTTPTLIGDRFVTFGDNAEPQMNVIVLERKDGREVCKKPVFCCPKEKLGKKKEGKSACENSFIVFDNSIVVSNSYGYTRPVLTGQNHTQGGMTRIDVRPGGRGCDVKWSTDFDAMTATPQLSIPTGLIYVYDRPVKGITNVGNWWALTGIDFQTGEPVLRVTVGKGIRYDNGWGPLTLPHDRSVLVGIFTGFLRIKDR